MESKHLSASSVATNSGQLRDLQYDVMVWCENTGLCDAPSAASAVV